MKVRAGFVSNSSSSSFVVVLPDNFLEKIDYDKIVDGNEKFPLDKFKSLVETFVHDKYMYDEQIYEYDKKGKYDFYDHLIELVRPYVIADIDGSSDDGKIVVVDKSDVMKVLGL
jgi:hypothetical protein